MKGLIFILVALFSLNVLAEDPKYCNGQIMKDSWSSYYPNGQIMKDFRGDYFPNGTLVKDTRSTYYPNGQAIQDSWGTYYPNKQAVKNTWGVYYHNGQVVKNSWGCYFSNGQKMEPCQEILTSRIWISQSLVMDYTLNATSGDISNLQFEEYVANTRTRYQLSLDGKVSNVVVSCDLNLNEMLNTKK
jgi:hypothetical protein